MSGFYLETVQKKKSFRRAKRGEISTTKKEISHPDKSGIRNDIRLLVISKERSD